MDSVTYQMSEREKCSTSSSVLCAAEIEAFNHRSIGTRRPDRRRSEGIRTSRPVGMTPPPGEVPGWTRPAVKADFRLANTLQCVPALKDTCWRRASPEPLD